MFPFRITVSQGKGFKCRPIYNSLKSWDYSHLNLPISSKVKLRKIKAFANKTVSSYLKTALDISALKTPQVNRMTILSWTNQSLQE